MTLLSNPPRGSVGAKRINLMKNLFRLPRSLLLFSYPNLACLVRRNLIRRQKSPSPISNIFWSKFGLLIVFTSYFSVPRSLVATKMCALVINRQLPQLRQWPTAKWVCPFVCQSDTLVFKELVIFKPVRLCVVNEILKLRSCFDYSMLGYEFQSSW